MTTFDSLALGALIDLARETEPTTVVKKEHGKGYYATWNNAPKPWKYYPTEYAAAEGALHYFLTPIYRSSPQARANRKATGESELPAGEVPTSERDIVKIFGHLRMADMDSGTWRLLQSDGTSVSGRCSNNILLIDLLIDFIPYEFTCRRDGDTLWLMSTREAN